MSSLKSLPYALVFVTLLAANAPAGQTCPSEDLVENMTVRECKLVVTPGGDVLEKNITFQECSKKRLLFKMSPTSIADPVPKQAVCAPQ